MKLVKVEGQGSLMKDLDTGSVLNGSVEEFTSFKIRRQKEKSYQDKISSLEQRLAAIEKLILR